MYAMINFAKKLLNVLYTILKIFPTKHKVVFLSRQSDDSNPDFDLLSKQLKQDDSKIKVVILTKMIHAGLFSKLAYGFHMLRQMYHLATSEVAVLDTYCIAVSILHHKNTLKVIQMWHAVGAFKKFGYSVIGKREGSSEKLASMMQMHENYDYVCTSSKETLPYFAQAFHVQESKMIVKPLPRLDLLRQEDYRKQIRERIYQKYPFLQTSGKKVIVYAPTFRKREANMKAPILELLNHMDQEKYILIVKLHPLTKENLDGYNVLQDDNFDTLEMCLIADAVITDYSAVIFEAAFIQKPIYLYAYDYKDYVESRDFYLDYEKDMPQEVMFTAQSVMLAIENTKYDMVKLKSFVDKNITKPQISYTKDMSDFILKLCNK